MRSRSRARSLAQERLGSGLILHGHALKALFPVEDRCSRHPIVDRAGWSPIMSRERASRQIAMSDV
jgi:hypothetical protein